MATVTVHDVSTDELQPGDVVVTHGIRVWLDVEAQRFAGSGNLPECWSWVGLVLNVEEVRASGVIPVSHFYFDGIGQRRTEPRYNVQGNHNARWTVERQMEAHGVNVGDTITGRDVTTYTLQTGTVREIRLVGSHDLRTVLDVAGREFPAIVHI